MQAMLSAHEHLLHALFECSDQAPAVLRSFVREGQAMDDMLVATDFTDEELAMEEEARAFLFERLRSLLRKREVERD